MDFFSQVLLGIKSHMHIIFTGTLGATFGFLLSQEPVKDRLIGFFCGFILCIVFAEPASHFLANDAYPELFGFILGAIGKSSAEAGLQLIRGRVLTTIDSFHKDKDKDGDSENANSSNTTGNQ